MQENETEETEAKEYVKPQLRRVELRPEEAILGNCKTANSNGPGSLGNCGIISCSSQGS